MSHHHPTYWLGVAAVLGLALLAMEAAGQSASQPSPNAGAVFQGRPLMSGAQGGQGAQAGPAQGGIGLQGSDGAARKLRGPSDVQDQAGPLPATACPDAPRTSTGEQPLCLPDVRDERLDRRRTGLGLEPEKR
ncbi:hypothetical protein WG902_19535 [Ramlibacter sp. PS3R-8]|uniref:hypothetical protein n=1 Tax=Ramlibacter sp. PS3R-8 TaxID=3133437 RepID=UPI00309D7432